MRIMDDRIVQGAPWRKLWQPALFRDALFYVETDNRAGGRRVAVHEYPKRNMPYSEDMGRKAVRVTVQGYLIGRPGVNYITLKDRLVAALEMDGPGRLRLPMQYVRRDLQVMVQAYSISESRERGGMCTVEMDFIEYGDPVSRSNISTSAEIDKSAAAVDRAAVGTPTETTAQEVAPYAQVHQQAFEPTNEQSQDIHSGVRF